MTQFRRITRPLADLPTVRMPACRPLVVTIPEPVASDMRAALLPGESEQEAVVRFFSFWAWWNRPESDTALAAAMARMEAQS